MNMGVCAVDFPVQYVFHRAEFFHLVLFPEYALGLFHQFSVVADG